MLVFRVTQLMTRICGMKLLNRIRQTGWRYSFAIAFNRVVPQWLFRTRRYVIFRMDNPSEPAAEGQVTVFQCDDEQQIQAVEQLTYFRREYSSGQCHAFAAEVDGQLAGGMWAATECFDENELGVRLQLANNQTWLCSALICKDMRGHGVYSRLLPFVIRSMANSGKPDALVAVNPDNLASYHAHKKRSRETVGYVFAIRFLKLTACWVWGGVSKQRTFSANSNERPIEIRVPVESH